VVAPRRLPSKIDEVAGNRILVVEDEPGIVDFLVRGLEGQGFRVDTALDGVTGSEKALHTQVDLMILDMMLPRLSGSEILNRVRAAKPDLPVVVLTARGEVEDRVSGLDAGAVDYIVKPFSLAELLARVRAHLRVAGLKAATRLSSDGLDVDLLSREVSLDGRPVRLSSTEFELLVYLMRNAGRVLSREQILRGVWGYAHDPNTNVVDVYIGYLRRKLRRGEREAQITTVRSVGYRFDGDV
jgi:DNA-binding response OmpR family regulator